MFLFDIIGLLYVKILSYMAAVGTMKFFEFLNFLKLEHTEAIC